MVQRFGLPKEPAMGGSEKRGKMKEAFVSSLLFSLLQISILQFGLGSVSSQNIGLRWPQKWPFSPVFSFPIPCSLRELHLIPSSDCEGGREKNMLKIGKTLAFSLAFSIREIKNQLQFSSRSTLVRCLRNIPMHFPLCCCSQMKCRKYWNFVFVPWLKLKGKLHRPRKRRYGNSRSKGAVILSDQAENNLASSDLFSLLGKGLHHSRGLFHGY